MKATIPLKQISAYLGALFIISAQFNENICMLACVHLGPKQ